MMYTAAFPSPVGTLTAWSDGTSLLGLWIAGQKHLPPSLSALTVVPQALDLFSCTQEWLDRYFSGRCPSPRDLPLAPQGSAFRQTVWQCLLDIPYGEITTYGAIAAHVALRLGRPTMSAQAIGGAVGHNPISIIIPCHRVIGADGSLTGYDGGLDIKRYLLTHEGISIQPK